MQRDFSVRRFVDADRGALAHVYRAAWSQTYSPILSDAELAAMLAELDEHGVGGIVPGNDEVAYVAIAEDLVVGSAVFAERRGTAYLWGMYIDPAYQRLGIGTALLAYGAEQLSAGAVIEASVVKTSSWAVSFYRKLGFQFGTEYDFEIVTGHSVPTVRMDISRERLLARLGALGATNPV